MINNRQKSQRLRTSFAKYRPGFNHPPGQSRKKQLEKMDLMDRPLHELKKATFQFQVNKTSGNQVALIHELMIGYDQSKPLAGPLTFNLTKGERVAFIGPNGQGKTTLLKTLTEAIPNLGGQLRYGSNVETGFYNQEQEDLHLDPPNRRGACAICPKE